MLIKPGVSEEEQLIAEIDRIWTRGDSEGQVVAMSQSDWRTIKGYIRKLQAEKKHVEGEVRKARSEYERLVLRTKEKIIIALEEFLDGDDGE